MSRLSLTLAIVLALALGACDRGAPEPAQESGAGGQAALAGEIDRSHAGELMPAVNLAHPQGRVLNLGAMQGTPVLLNLWATWCAPCVTEMPLLDELAADMDGNLRVITASQDLQGAQRVVPFFEQHEFSHLQPWMDPANQLTEALGDNLPTSVLYDASGQEVWRVVGDLDWSSPQARAAIDEALPASDP